MSDQWKATMPKEKPRAGMVHVVFAFKSANGQRIEFTGQAQHEGMLRALNIVTESARSVRTDDAKESTTGAGTKEN